MTSRLSTRLSERIEFPKQITTQSRPSSPDKDLPELKVCHHCQLRYSHRSSHYHESHNESNLNHSRVFEKGYIKRAEDSFDGYGSTSRRQNKDPEPYDPQAKDVQDENFKQFGEDFEADLETVTQRLESQLKQNFDNMAHNILHRHLVNQ